MQPYVVLGILSLVFPVLSWAGGAPTWYSILWGSPDPSRPPSYRCYPSLSEWDTPAGAIEWAQMKGYAYRMENVTEGGQVVETTMISQEDRYLPGGPRTWYRGQARCEQALRKQEEAAARTERQRQRGPTRGNAR